jgi:tellurite resistance protein
MSIRTVLAHLTPLSRQLRNSILPGGGDPSLLFNSVVEGGFLVAMADGTMDETEFKTLKDAVLALNDGMMTTEEVDTLFEDLMDLRKTAGEAARCQMVGQLLHESHASEEGLYLAAAIAYVSGGLDARELAVLERIATSAHVSGAALATIATSVREEISRRSLVAN